MVKSFGWQWHPDRIWTESNWPSDPYFTVAIIESDKTSIRVFIAGITITFFTVMVTMGLRLMYHRQFTSV